MAKLNYIERKHFYVWGRTLMNKNEECLLKFLEYPARLYTTTEELKRFIFSVDDNIINNEFSMKENKSA
jgi:hypothetical protein